MSPSLTVQAHAQTLDGGKELAIEADTPVPLGSVFKLSVSDNAAADAIIERVGIPVVNRVLEDLGLHASRVRADCQGVLASLAADLQVPLHSLPEVLARAGADPELDVRLRRAIALHVERGNSSTPRDLTSLLSALWSDTALPPVRAVWCRYLLGTQIYRPLLSQAFMGRARVAGKSGMLPSVRGEGAMVTFPDGWQAAVAVFVQGSDCSYAQPEADALLKRTATDLVAQLRMAGAGP